ncbi:MAG: type I 3-dehydroquinate dehydratase [Treponemataceae bacterium]|nr:type I 3-dehydroquinate dehydratase [Treponemataceae bacterium]
MAKVCICLTGKTIAQNLEILEAYRPYIDVAELRVDCLEPDERFFIRRFPSLAGVPTILTVRRKIDGGFFTEGEGARIVLLAAGLAFADADRRNNFAYVDLEEDLNVPSLEEAARTFGTRIIRSYHNFQGVDENLPERIRALRRHGDEIAKVAVMPQNLQDVARIFVAAEETQDVEKILLGMGPHGVCTRILAEKMGSYLTFASPRLDPALPIAGPGQLDPKQLVNLYRFRDITKTTKVYGIVGYPLTATSSPEIHNRGFKNIKFDGVYIPFPADTLASFLELAEVLQIEGASVTVPYKEAILARLAGASPEVQKIGSCNTILRTSRGWFGYNTDARGFSDSLLTFIGKKDLKWKRCTIVGAGGVARAVAYEIHRLGGRACVVNRTVPKAKELAEPFGFAWGGLDSRGMELVEKYRDIIIQTTSVGMEGPDVDKDPLEQYRFTGKEMVMDLIYKPEITRLLERASRAGCRVLNGYDMLYRQAKLQFRLFTGQEYPE